MSGSDTPLLSANVSVIALTALLPPASDIKSTVWPVGPTSKTSISSGDGCVRFTSVADTLVTSPVNPETTFDEG